MDEPGIRRLLRSHDRSLVQRWVRITEAAMHEKPRGFAGFKVSPAAFLIDGVQHQRTPPDWFHGHEKRRQKQQWDQQQATLADDEADLRQGYQTLRAAALEAYLASSEGKQKYEHALECYRAFYQATDPHRAKQAAHEAVLTRIERVDFKFPDYAAWSVGNSLQADGPA